MVDKKLLLVLMSLILMSCYHGDYNSHIDAVNKDCLSSAKERSDQNGRDTNFKATVNGGLFFDTVSLSVFWDSFQTNLRTGKKDQVIGAFKLPIHASHFVNFKFSYNCDTSWFVNHEKEYISVDVDSTNAHQYYDFLFDEKFKLIVSRLSISEILQKGRLLMWQNVGLTVYIRYREFFQAECHSDSTLSLSFIYQNGEWAIEVGGV